MLDYLDLCRLWRYHDGLGTEPLHFSIADGNIDRDQNTDFIRHEFTYLNFISNLQQLNRALTPSRSVVDADAFPPA